MPASLVKDTLIANRAAVDQVLAVLNTAVQQAGELKQVKRELSQLKKIARDSLQEANDREQYVEEIEEAKAALEEEVQMLRAAEVNKAEGKGKERASDADPAATTEPAGKAMPMPPSPFDSLQSAFARDGHGANQTVNVKSEDDLTAEIMGKGMSGAHEEDYFEL